MILLISTFLSGLQSPTGEYHLAIGLFTGAHSKMVTYAFVQTRNGEIIGSRVVREEEFMYKAMGYWPSRINPERVNLFEENDVDSCFLLYNDQQKVAGWYAKPFRDLWKIRFYEHPFQYDRPGWSQGQFKPSIYQRDFLRNRYGVNNVLSEYFYGDTLFKLLRDVQNDGWISSYKTAVADTTSGP